MLCNSCSTAIPLALIRVEVTAMSRTPAIRPAIVITPRLVMGFLVTVLSVTAVVHWFELLVVRWEFCVGEQSADGVFGADGWRRAVESFERPGDIEGGVVPEDGAFAGGVVEVGGFVEDFSGVGEDEEAVGEAFGDPEELKIVVCGLGFEVKAGPFAEVG